jgi:hypothetical protein
MMGPKIHDKDAENFIAAIPLVLTALKAVAKLYDQMIPALRFTGERRKKKFDQIEEMDNRRVVLELSHSELVALKNDCVTALEGTKPRRIK